MNGCAVPDPRASLPGRGAWLHPEHVLCSEEGVALWRRRGFAVNTWTVDDPVRIAELARWGVDGLFCNDPAAAIRALQAPR